MKNITREEAIQVLKNWQSHQLSAIDVFEWGNKLYLNEDIDYEDWEGDEPNSVTNEILAQLDSIDMNLIAIEDIPEMIKFLKTPVGNFEKGYKKWCDYIYSIDLLKRKKELKNIKLYEPFCK